MTGKAGVWMLLVLFPCLWTSTIRGVGGFSFPKAAPVCCGRWLDQSKVLIAGQAKIGKILLDNRKIIFEKVGQDVERVKKDVGTVLQNLAGTQRYLTRCQSLVLPNVTAIRDTQDHFQLNTTKFHDFVEKRFVKVKKLQEIIHRQHQAGQAAIAGGVKSEHQGTRKFAAETYSRLQGTLRDLGGVIKAVHASIEALIQKARPCCAGHPQRKLGRAKKQRNKKFNI